MFSLRKPTPEVIAGFIADQAGLAFTYPAVGSVAGDTSPAGYRFHHVRFPLGGDASLFGKAKAAFERWRQFDVGWAKAYRDDTPLEPGQTVAVEFHTLGLWCLSSARIVYAIDEPDRFGFAYGTLPGHVESGEEQFLVERGPDGAVYYDVRSFSRPRHLLTKLGHRYARRQQQRFLRDSAEAMRRAVASL